MEFLPYIVIEKEKSHIGWDHGDDVDGGDDYADDNYADADYADADDCCCYADIDDCCYAEGQEVAFIINWPFQHPRFPLIDLWLPFHPLLCHSHCRGRISSSGFQ